MTVNVRFRPGIQSSPSTEPATQRGAVAREVDRFKLTIQLAPGRVVTGAQLLALPDAELVRLGVNPNDLWELLDDVANEENEGQILDLQRREVGARYAVTDRMDGNYSRAIVTTPRGAASVGEVGEVRGEFSHRQWYHYLYEWLFEAFSFGAYESQIWDEPDRQVDAGRQMFDRAPATASALAADPAFRTYLISQRQNLSEGDWSDVVDNLLQGLRERAAENRATVARADSLPSLPARDSYLTAYVQADAATRTRLDAVRDIAATMPTNEAESFLEPLNGSATSRTMLLDMAETIRALPPVVRNQAALTIGLLRTREDADAFRALLSNSAFNAPGVTDIDRREALRLFANPALREAVPDFLTMMATDSWTSSSAETRQRLIQLCLSDNTAEGTRALARLWSSASIAGLSPAHRTAVVEALAAWPALVRRTERVDTLLATIAPMAEAVRNDILQGLQADNDFDGWLRLATIPFPAEAAPLSRVLYGTDSIGVGSTGHSAVIVQRYLQSFRTNDPQTGEEIPLYSATVGVTHRPSFDAATEAGVRQFQRDNNIEPANGRVDRRTLMAMIRAMPAQTEPYGIGPGAFTYLTTTSLNRPTASTDGSWRATQRWTPALEAEYQTFSVAYMRTRFNTGERLDCADLALETVVMFARSRGLPLQLDSGGGRTIRHNTPGIAIAASARAYLGAINIPHAGNTISVPLNQMRPSDIGIMDWDQSINGHDSTYNHTYNVVGWDNAERANTFLIYGSLTDEIAPAALAAFNARHNINPPIRAFSEYQIIDAINPDPNSADRARPASVYRPRIADVLREHGIASPTEAQITEVVNMVNQHTRRDQPTQIYSSEGLAAYSSISGPDLFSDPGVLEANRTTFNTTYSLNLTPAQMRRVLRAGSEAEKQTVAAELVASLPEARRAEATTALVAAVADSRRGRRYNFYAWNRFVP